MMVMLVDLNVVDLGEGGPSSLLRPRWVVPTLGRRLRTGLPLRPLTRGGGSDAVNHPRAWPTAVWGGPCGRARIDLRRRVGPT